MLASNLITKAERRDLETGIWSKERGNGEETRNTEGTFLTLNMKSH